MKVVWSILFPMSLLAVPLFVNAAAHSAGTNVLNNGTIYMVTTDGQLRPYTSQKHQYRFPIPKLFYNIPY